MKTKTSINNTKIKHRVTPLSFILSLVVPAIMIMSVLFVVSLLITSCDKTNPQPQGEMITQSFQLDNIINPYTMLKLFNPDTWVYDYDAGQHTITITDGENTYTENVSIEDLLTGTVTIDMLTGNYDVSYITPHPIDIEDNLDVSITNNVQIEGSPIILTGEYEDVMIVVDVADMVSVLTIINGTTYNTKSYGQEGVFLRDDVYYGYFNSIPDELRVEIDYGGYTEYTTITSAQFLNWEFGKIYHITSPIGGTLELNLPEHEYEKIIL